MSSLPLEARLSNVPSFLRIRVLHDCDEFIVIEKPCNLRSVPGHANPPPLSSSSSRKRPRPQEREQKTAQEAWILALQTFGEEEPTTTSDNNDSLSHQCLRRLSQSKWIQSAPRKRKVFRRYLERNQKHIIPQTNNKVDLDKLANDMFNLIQARQKPLMNLPEPTKHEESALGQLILLGYNGKGDRQSQNLDSKTRDKLFVVHRLDCETSGTMVFAKSESVASCLSKAWRERDQVSKHYLAVVNHWPPYHEEGIQEGTIDIPLSPSEERLKWKVDKDGKPSKTEWKVHSLLARQKSNDKKGVSEKPLVLELKPVTGRTHQLRIHCAHIGSGIEGDSLYGTNQTEFNPNDRGKLKLHAWKLIFPHPNGNETCEFSCDPTWIKEIETTSTNCA